MAAALRPFVFAYRVGTVVGAKRYPVGLSGDGRPEGRPPVSIG